MEREKLGGYNLIVVVVGKDEKSTPIMIISIAILKSKSVTTKTNRRLEMEEINPYTIEFNRDDKVVGTLFIDKDKMRFEGDVDASAKAFFDSVLMVYFLNHRTVPSEWISVEDRLPENGQSVAFVCGGKVLGGKYTPFEDKKWFSYPGTVCGATHWMPLPPISNLGGK